MKYIDSEKLIAEIERYKQGAAIARFDNAGENADYFQGKVDLCDDLTHIIDSLQQEQPEVDLEKEITKWMEAGDITDTRFDDYDDSDIERTARHFYELGLNARKDKLPEIELDKFTEKIKTFQGRYKHPEIVSIKGAMAFMARLFYQYPNVARQWYDNLPKATMD